MTIASLQLGVGVVYALFAWAAPDMRSAPSITFDDVKAMVPVAFCAMMAHCASVFAMSAGAVSFGQIVKAAEPAFAAVLSQFVYGKPISKAKWLCLIPVIGGVIIASFKELDFAVSALIAACSANLFAAFKGNENKKLMETKGLKDRLGTVGNQFAVTQIMAFIMSLPLSFTEGSKWGEFRETLSTNSVVKNNFLYSGLFFYGYNELATMTIKKTNAITQSVANTAKRVIVIIGVALVMGEALPAQKLIGSGDLHRRRHALLDHRRPDEEVGVRSSLLPVGALSTALELIAHVRRYNCWRAVPPSLGAASAGATGVGSPSQSPRGMLPGTQTRPTLTAPCLTLSMRLLQPPCGA